jgi:hypothetical protein
VVENADLTIPEQNEKVYYALRHLEEVIPQLSIPEEEE